MKISSTLFTLMISLSSLAQPGVWTSEDSLKGEAMINTIEQSLMMFYAENSEDDNYDSIIAALNYESDAVPSYSNEVYCERLNEMNEMSPFHLDCNAATLSTIKFFTENRRGFARVVLGRSKLYFDMFEKKLAEHNLPIELKYLAVIESGLRPQVKSRAGALGLWQFMYATGRMFGLEENSYVDERMDPELATDAACQYLKKLYGIYNDWNLALAAYNAGPGNVNKAIRRSGNKLTYWEVRPFLPKETQGYVPNFIAAAYLLTYHAEHNIVPVEALVEYDQLDTMCLKKGVHFATIGKLVNMEVETIAALNPIFKTNYIPKGVKSNYCVSLPLDKIGKLVTLEDSLYALEYDLYTKKTVYTPELPAVVDSADTSATATSTYDYHKVKAGETLHSIATRYGMSLTDIQRVNGLTATKIYVGQRLKVTLGSNPNTVVNPVTPTPTPTPVAAKQYYTVRAGDTFGKVAQRHRLTITQLKNLNPRINIDRISVGQKLRVK